MQFFKNFYALFSFRIALYYIDEVYMNEKCQITKSAVTLPYRCNTYVSQPSQKEKFSFCDTWLT